MSNETKKYKVLLPTNGLEVGSIVELTEAEAEGFNANEPRQRVEKVIESKEIPPDEGEDSGDKETPKVKRGKAKK